MEMSKSKAVSILGWALFSASWLLAVFITAYISIISEHVTGRLIDWSNLTFQGMIFYIIIILFVHRLVHGRFLEVAEFSCAYEGGLANFHQGLSQK